MKYIKLALVAAALTATAGCSMVPDSTNYAQSSETVTLSGTIESIDLANRLFKVRNGGTAVVFRAGPQVKNFAELEPGDEITLSYYESIAVGMAAPNDPGNTTREAIVGTAPLGERPGADVVGSTTAVVEFLSYDPDRKTATIRLADGTTETVRVPEEMQAFAAARTTGDRVVVTVDRAMAVTVTPAI